MLQIPENINNTTPGKSYFITILKLAVPIYIGFISTTVSMIIDTIWLGHYSSNAVAAATAASFMENILYAFIFVVTLGMTVLISNRLGQKKYTEIKAIIRTGTFLTLILTLAVSTAGYFFRSGITTLIVSQNSVDIKSSIADFLAVLFIGLFTLYGQCLVEGILKGNKDTKTPMKAAVITNIINLCLDPLLIFGLLGFPKLGIIGAALATAIGRGVGLLYTLYILNRSSLILKIRKIQAPFRFLLTSFDILRIGIPLSLDFLLRMLGGIVLIRIISQFGPLQVAAFGIAMKVIILATSAFHGINQSGSILTSRQIGEGKPGDTKIIGENAIILGIVIAVFFLITFNVLNKLIISVFTKDLELIQAGVTVLTYVTIYLLPYAFCISIGGIFAGSGKGKILLAASVIGVAFQLLLSYILSSILLHDATGVWMGMISASMIQVLFLAGFFYFSVVPTMINKTQYNI